MGDTELREEDLNYAGYATLCVHPHRFDGLGLEPVWIVQEPADLALPAAWSHKSMR